MKKTNNFTAILKTAMIIAFTVIIGFGATACGGGGGSKFDGSWKGDESTIIFKGNTWILLYEDGDENKRGTFSAKDDSKINLNTEYETFYLEDKNPAASKVPSKPKDFSYTLKKDILAIESMGDFTKTKIASDTLKIIENAFTANRKNPDLRDTVNINNQIYSTRFSFDIYDMIENGGFGDFIEERDNINSVFKNNTLYIAIENVKLDEGTPQSKILTKGDILDVSGLFKAEYIGEDYSFGNYFSRWGVYYSFTIYGTLSFENGDPIFVISSIIKSDTIGI